MDNTKEKNIHAAHRARMKKIFLEYGFDSFSEVEKIEFFLYFAVPFKDTNPLAHRLIDEYQDFNGIINAPYESLIKVKGVGEHVAIFIKMIQASISEYYKSAAKEKVKIHGTIGAAEFCKNLYVAKQREELVIICINNNCEITNYKTIIKGGVNEITIQIRDITEFVINTNADRIIVSHNHPSGTPNPSDDDFSFTSRLAMSMMLNNISVVDHIIVSPYGTYSMAEEKTLEPLIKQAIKAYNIPPITPKSSWTPYEPFK